MKGTQGALLQRLSFERYEALRSPGSAAGQAVASFLTTTITTTPNSYSTSTASLNALTPIFARQTMRERDDAKKSFSSLCTKDDVPTLIKSSVIIDKIQPTKSKEDATTPVDGATPVKKNKKSGKKAILTKSSKANDTERMSATSKEKEVPFESPPPPTPTAPWTTTPSDNDVPLVIPTHATSATAKKPSVSSVLFMQLARAKLTEQMKKKSKAPAKKIQGDPTPVSLKAEPKETKKSTPKPMAMEAMQRAEAIAAKKILAALEKKEGKKRSPPPVESPAKKNKTTRSNEFPSYLEAIRAKIGLKSAEALARKACREEEEQAKKAAKAAEVELKRREKLQIRQERLQRLEAQKKEAAAKSLAKKEARAMRLEKIEAAKEAKKIARAEKAAQKLREKEAHAKSKAALAKAKEKLKVDREKRRALEEKRRLAAKKAAEKQMAKKLFEKKKKQLIAQKKQIRLEEAARAALAKKQQMKLAKEQLIKEKAAKKARDDFIGMIMAA